MKPLADSDLLLLWEGGMRRHPLDRALLALGAAMPETPYERLADWPLGRRNRSLAELRSRSFGSHFQGWIACASCGEKLEFELDSRVIVDAGREADESAHGDAGETIIVNQQAFRLPTSRDLALAVHESDARLAAIRIVESCRVALPHAADLPASREAFGVSDPAAENWSDDALDEIGERMAVADPLAETRLSLHCPHCECDWEETLDIGAFMWAEIEARARRLLREVHILAMAYGWTEAEVLALGENRRARYVEMVQS